MIASTTIIKLNRLIQGLQRERQQHADAVAVIDAAFTSLSITPRPAVRRGRKPGTAKAMTASTSGAVSAGKPGGKRRRTRRKAKDGMTGEQFLLTLLAKAKLSTADVNKRWTESGRKNVANILIGKLVKDGKVKRAAAKGVRGSVYSAA